MNNTRVSALIAVPVTAIAVLYAASAAFTWEPSLGWLIQALIHLGELAAVVALASSGAVGASRPGRAGLAVAATGQILLAVAEVVWPRQPDLGNVLFGIAPILTGAGLITAGITLFRPTAAAGCRSRSAATPLPSSSRWRSPPAGRPRPWRWPASPSGMCSG